VYRTPPIQGTRDTNPGWNFSHQLDPPARDHTDNPRHGPHVELPRFDGTNPRMWQIRYEDYC
jgi:hypothetical protein